MIAPIFARKSASKLRSLEPWIALGLPALIFLGSLGRAGLWDPYELNVADIARRTAIHLFRAPTLAFPGADNRLPTLGDVGHGDLPILSIALSFKLFGLSSWSGRLPMALWAIAGLGALWLWLRRMAAARAGAYAVLLLTTMPLYFVQARTMLGDIVMMAAQLFAFAGLCVVVLDPKPEPLRFRLAWALLAALGLAAGFATRGALLGVSIPALSIGLAWLLGIVNNDTYLDSDIIRNRAGVELNEHNEAKEVRAKSAPEGTVVPKAQWALGLSVLLIGVTALLCGIKGYREATPAKYDMRLGAAVISLSKLPTFDTVLQYLGHSLFPWSAFLPLAFGRIGFMRSDLASVKQARQRRLRLVLIVGASLSYGAYAWVAPRTGHIPFGGVGVLAALGALVLYDYECGAHPSRALSVACCLLAGVLYLDLTRMPEKAMSAFGIANLVFPESPSFRQEANQLILITTGVFCAFLFFSFLEEDATLQPPSCLQQAALSRWRYLTAWDEMQRLFTELGGVWNGSFAFAAVMLEAALAGLAVLIFVGQHLGWNHLLRQNLSGEFKAILLNAWWSLPVYLCGGLFLFLTIRRLLRIGMAYWRIPRAWLAAGGGIVAGLILNLVYYPALANQVSPKEVFDSYQKLKRDHEPIGLLGVTGRSAAYYSGGEAKSFADPQQAFSWLTETEERRWLAVHADELSPLNALYRARAREESALTTPDHNVPVLEARSSQTLLVSNRLLAGERNENPLAAVVGLQSPQPAHRVEANLNDQLQALGWDLYDTSDNTHVDGVVPGKRYTLRLYYRVIAPLTTEWAPFIHIDGYGRRFNGDHKFDNGKYAMSLWQVGDLITDSYDLQLEPNFTPGTYTLFYGFWWGDSRLPVNAGNHSDNRIDGGPFQVR